MDADMLHFIREAGCKTCHLGKERHTSPFAVGNVSPLVVSMIMKL